MDESKTKSEEDVIVMKFLSISVAVEVTPVLEDPSATSVVSASV